ncbi:MAG: hypothetical protein GTN78_03970, partial [Gemmatimonadales bacterium]|nr:hypothetical protein [Gemmatimonadales bacterium]
MRLQQMCAIALTALIAAGCAGGGMEWAGAITDSAGVAIVSNPAEGMWTEADAWTVEEELK